MTVNLTQVRQISLTNTDGRPLTLIRLGPGWKATPRQGFLTRFPQPHPRHRRGYCLLGEDRAVEHSGDNRTGNTGPWTGPGGDDEFIGVNLPRRLRSTRSCAP